MRELEVPIKYEGKKLNTFLLDSFDGLSLNLLYKTLRKKDIRVNDQKVSENVLLHAGDHVKIYLTDEQLYKESNCSIAIVYEDENIVVVNKHSGIEVTGEHSLTSSLISYYLNLNINNNSQELKLKNINSKEVNLEEINSQKISNRNKSIFIAPCHRLDRNTTGLVLFAKNEEALSILLDKFKNHEIEKHYRAMVIGVPLPKKATLTAYLFKDRKKSLVYISDFPKKGYEKIVTSYEVLSTNNNQNTSMLDVTLHTGKTHQIRAHLAHIGHPIVGDGKYGNNEMNKKLGFKLQQLCSYSLQFCFKTDSGILNYLSGKKIIVK